MYYTVMCYSVLCCTVLHYPTLSFPILYTIPYYTIVYWIFCTTMYYIMCFNTDQQKQTERREKVFCRERKRPNWSFFFFFLNISKSEKLVNAVHWDDLNGFLGWTPLHWPLSSFSYMIYCPPNIIIQHFTGTPQSEGEKIPHNYRKITLLQK